MVHVRGAGISKIYIKRHCHIPSFLIQITPYWTIFLEINRGGPLVCLFIIILFFSEPNSTEEEIILPWQKEKELNNTPTPVC